MFDVITFGSSTVDIFLKVKKLSFKAGSKVLIDNLKVMSGGGGTNTACTFSKQGLKTAYVGLLSNDVFSNIILKDLKRFRIKRFLSRTDKKTAFSLILSPFQKERTILFYEGASHFLSKKDIPFKKIKKAKWFYIAPLHKKSALLLKPLVRFAKENNIKVALNPAKEMLNSSRELFKDIDFLLMNKEEIDSLIKGPLKKKIKEMPSKITAITSGKKGVLIWDRKNLFEVYSNNVPVVEKTGAGDAFGSGFVSGLVKKNDIEYAIQVAVSNAESCIQKLGAKQGLISKGKLTKVRYKKI